MSLVSPGRLDGVRANAPAGSGAGARGAAPFRAGMAFALFVLVVAGCSPQTTVAISHPFDPDSIPEAYRFSTAALMWPGATRAFQVTPAGALYNGEWLAHIRPAVSGAHGGPATAPRVIAYEERWLPIAHWTRASGNVQWHFEAAALPAPAPLDSALIVTLAVEATNRGTVPVNVSLDVVLGPPDSSVVFVAADAPRQARALRWARAGATAEASGWTTLGGDTVTASGSWTLAPGASVAQRLILPSYAMPGRELNAWARASHATRAEASRTAWRKLLDQGTEVSLGDPEVERALRAATVVLLACRERRGADWLPIGGPFHYRDVWLRDGARHVAALSVAGFTREAREMAAGLLRFQWQTGVFMSQRGQLDGTGQALWSFEQALLRPAPADDLSPFIDAALRAIRWCETARATSRSLGVAWGPMLPPADPRDNELIAGPLVGNDAWGLAGYRATERLLRAAGRADEARAVATARDGYARDFDAELARARHADLPACWTGGGRDWGNLAAAQPCGALPVDDPRVHALARRVWTRAGGAGLLNYGPVDTLHYYLGADLAVWAMRVGERAAADSVLEAMLAWRSASGGAAEAFARDTRDFGRNLPPHSTGAAMLVHVIRDALVYDDEGTLQLTLGARARWWRGTRVRRLPTRWGVIELEFEQRGDVASWTWTAVPVPAELTLPPGTVLEGPLDAPLRPGPRPDVVIAPPGTREASVRVRASRGGER